MTISRGVLQEMGIKRLDPPPGIESNGLWFRDHDGILVEIKVAAKSSPDEKTHFGLQAGLLPASAGLRIAARCRERGRGGSRMF